MHLQRQRDQTSCQLHLWMFGGSAGYFKGQRAESRERERERDWETGREEAALYSLTGTCLVMSSDSTALSCVIYLPWDRQTSQYSRHHHYPSLITSVTLLLFFVCFLMCRVLWWTPTVLCTVVPECAVLLINKQIVSGPLYTDVRILFYVFDVTPLRPQITLQLKDSLGIVSSWYETQVNNWYRFWMHLRPEK